MLKKRALELVITEQLEPKEIPARAQHALDAVCVVEHTVIPPQTEALVLVQCHLSGLRIIEGHSELWEKKCLIAANGDVYVKPYAIFSIKIGNFNKYAALQRNELVGRAIKAHVPLVCNNAIEVVIPGMNNVTDTLSI